jgi:hypothetical protein
MNALITAMQTKDTLTENGMPTHSTSGRKVVDLFYKMGGARSLGTVGVQAMFAEAFGESATLATKAAFYNRDVRGGQGERETFRAMFHWLCEYAPETAVRNIPNVPFYGRWDDLFVAQGTAVELAAFEFYAQALQKGDGLAAKWAPREGKARNAPAADKLRRTLKLSWQDYRKLLAGNTKVIETALCRKEWAAINYSHVPSMAIKKYRKSFYKNDAERYMTWVAELQKAPAERAPGVKINASAIYPHDIAKPFIRDNAAYWDRGNRTNAAALEAQWKALPNYMGEGRKVIPVIDVSESMFGDHAVEVAVSLGLYVAERNVGPFKDVFISFSQVPQLYVLKNPSLEGRVKEVFPTKGYNTNLQAVFQLVLGQAVKHNVPADEMPNTILLLSDMQFDRCLGDVSASAIEMIDQMYTKAGYARPNIVFWNLRTSSGVPVKVDERGTALVSGFSPSILEQVLGGDEMTPQAVMLRKLTSERYERVTA